jgi:hypothetical protein
MNYLSSFLIPIQAFAQERITNPVTGELGDNPEAAKSGVLLTGLFVKFWRIAINMGALVVMLFYVLAAYEWITSGSDAGGTEKARQRFINATIGLILLVASFAIVAFVGELLFGDNFDLLNLTFPTLTNNTTF